MEYIMEKPVMFGTERQTSFRDSLEWLGNGKV